MWVLCWCVNTLGVRLTRVLPGLLQKFGLRLCKKWLTCHCCFYVWLHDLFTCSVQLASVKKWSQWYFFWDATETCCSASAGNTGCDRLQWSHDSQCSHIWRIPSVTVCRQGRDPQKLLKDWKVEFVCFSWSVNDVIIFHQFDTSNSSKCCFWITVIIFC